MVVLTILLSATVALTLILYLIVKNKYRYWKNKNVTYLEPTFFFGNYGEHLRQKQSIGETLKYICNKFPKEPYIGAYFGTEPVLILQEPEYIKLVLSKDFTHFSSRELMEFVSHETAGQSLLMTYGEEWKFTRTNLTPMFTTSKLKGMFHLIQSCTEGFEKYLDKEVKDKPFEARDLMASYTMACFVSTAFGVDLNFYEGSNVFKTMGEKLFLLDKWRFAQINLRLIWPSLFYGMGFRMINKEITVFFNKLLTDVFEARNYKPSSRNDFVDALLLLKESTANKYKKIDDDYLIAQCTAIFSGGFETSATTLGFLLYELAKHEEIQDKVLGEIDEYLKKNDGKITFECQTDLPYSNACLAETLRLYPIIGVIPREVTKKYTLPTGVVLEKGIRIHIPLLHLHHNPEFFPKPEEFIPERFYGEDKLEKLPSAYMPFGDGPRACIGKRFAKMQTMSGLVAALKSHKAVLADGMPTTLEYEAKAFTTQALGGIHLRFLKRK